MDRHKKKAIPKAVREQVWLESFGKVYEHKCYVRWCKNVISVFDLSLIHISEPTRLLSISYGVFGL